MENQDQSNNNDLFSQLQRMMNGDFWGAVSQLQRMRMNSSSSPNSWGMEFPFQTFFPGMNMEELSKLMQQLQAVGGGWMRGTTGVVPPTKEGLRTSIEESFPIQIWESKDKVYLMAMLPGLKSEQDVKYTLKDDRHLTLNVTFPDLKPHQESRLVHSEVPLREVERTVTLPYPVGKGRSTSHYVKGVYTVILYKIGVSPDDVWSDLGEE